MIIGLNHIFCGGYRRWCVSGFLLENFDWRVGSDRTLESDRLAPLKLFIISGSRPVQNKFFPRKTRPKFYNYFSNRRKNVKWSFSTFSPNTLHTQNFLEILQSLMKNFNPIAVGIFWPIITYDSYQYSNNLISFNKNMVEEKTCSEIGWALSSICIASKIFAQ